MHRVYICGDIRFPRGGAGSNYVQYLGLALMDAGYDVHVVSTINPEFKENNYKGMLLHAFEYKKIKLIRFLDYHIGAQFRIKSILMNECLDENDIIILYSHNLFLGYILHSFAKCHRVKIGASVVEYFSEADFARGRHDYEYKMDKCLNTKILTKYDFLLPISHYIRKKFMPTVEKQLVLPIMADPYEFNYQEKAHVQARKYVFPANGRMKDALSNMVIAINDVLKDNQTLDVEFHFCGIKIDKILDILSMENSENLDQRIVIHSWMKYEELVELYQKMDFLLLAREVNEMTKANFPSKVPELMTYGVIPVVSKVGDYTKIYLHDEENSFVFEGCTVPDIRGAIERTFKMDPSKLSTISLNARKTVENEFSYKVWSNKLKIFLDQCLQS